MSSSDQPQSLSVDTSQLNNGATMANGKALFKKSSNYIEVGDSTCWEINQFSFPKQYQGYVEKVSSQLKLYCLGWFDLIDCVTGFASSWSDSGPDRETSSGYNNGGFRTVRHAASIPQNDMV